MMRSEWMMLGWVLLALTAGAVEPAVPELMPDDVAALQTVAGVVELFQKAPGALWPGYDLAVQPVLVYRPGRWVVLLNPPPETAGFNDYPADWPPLGVPVRWRPGPDPGLVGQLVFDHDLGTCRVAAIPLDPPPGVESPAVYLFQFVIHEAFHQFQRTTFRDVEIPTEEKYPILDSENAAQAALEMFILRDAVRAAAHGDAAAAREMAAMFIAVRRYRWAGVSEALRRFERGKEITEGSARYVEFLAADRMGVLCRAGATVNSALCAELATQSVAASLVEDFTTRFRDSALGPGDVARNRIYPVGAAIGYLLDFLGADWKSTTAALPEAATLADLLTERLGPELSDPDVRRQEAERRYALDRIRGRCEELRQEYVRGFEMELATFQDRPGTRMMVELPASGTSRSRSSTGPRWVMDEGRRVLGGYTIYVLKRPNRELFFEAKDRPVLDELPSAGVRRVTCTVERIDSLVADGVELDPATDLTRAFDTLRLEAAGVRLEAGRPGALTIQQGRVAVRLTLPDK